MPMLSAELYWGRVDGVSAGSTVLDKAVLESVCQQKEACPHTGKPRPTQKRFTGNTAAYHSTSKR